MATTNFPVNPELSAVAIAFKNPGAALIADEVLPRRAIGTKKFNYTKYGSAQGFTVPDTKVGRKSEPNMVDFGGVLVTAECQDFALDNFLPNDDIENFANMQKPSEGGPIDPLKLNTMMLTNLILLAREIRVANLVFNAATYQASLQTTLSGTSQWSNYTDSDPVAAILNILDQPLVRPNTLVIGQAAWTKLRAHPKMVQAIRGTAQNSGAVAREEFASFFEVEKLLVGQGFVNTAKPNQTPNYQRVWGKHFAALSISQLAADMDQPNFGFTAQFGSKIAGTIPEPKIGINGGQTIRVGEQVLEVVSANELGYFAQNVVS